MSAHHCPPHGWPHCRVKSVALTGLVEVDSEIERLRDPNDRGETGVAPGRQCLAQALAAHTGAAREIADVSGTGHHPDCGGDDRSVVAAFADLGLQMAATSSMPSR